MGRQGPRTAQVWTAALIFSKSNLLPIPYHCHSVPYRGEVMRKSVGIKEKRRQHNSICAVRSPCLPEAQKLPRSLQSSDTRDMKSPTSLDSPNYVCRALGTWFPIQTPSFAGVSRKMSSGKEVIFSRPLVTILALLGLHLLRALKFTSPILGKWPCHWKWAGKKWDYHDKRWDGWMASPVQKTWVWASSGRQWRTGKPGMLQSWGHKSRTQLSDWTTNMKGLVCVEQGGHLEENGLNLCSHSK